MVQGNTPGEQFLLGNSHWMLTVHYDGLYVNTTTEASPSAQSRHPLLAETPVYNQHFHSTAIACFYWFKQLFSDKGN